MKKISFILLFMLSFSAYSGPFIVCDAPTDAGVTGTSSSIDTQSFIDNDLVTGKCKIDLQPGTSTLSNGLHTIKVKFYKDDAIWWRVESSATNFTFTKPGVIAAPGGLGLQK